MFPRHKKSTSKSQSTNNEVYMNEIDKLKLENQKNNEHVCY